MQSHEHFKQLVIDLKEAHDNILPTFEKIVTVSEEGSSLVGEDLTVFHKMLSKLSQKIQHASCRFNNGVHEVIHGIDPFTKEGMK